MLEKIILQFPVLFSKFTDKQASLLKDLGQTEDHILKLTGSDPSYYPVISLDFRSERPGVEADFVLSNGETLTVRVENVTGSFKQSQHAYSHIDIDVVWKRLIASSIRLVGIDHAGINLPWFASAIHPAILQLRNRLSPLCLYHRFPTGEAWDFILPGNSAEIAGYEAVDYRKVRRPKFELVSFAKASKPLIQMDVSVDAGYETFAQLFPEALDDPEFRNIWVYLENPSPVDICLVINEVSEKDWSDFFAGSRL